MGKKVPRRDEIQGGTSLSDKEVRKAAKFLVDQIVGIIRTGRMPADDVRRVYAGFASDDKAQPVIYPIFTYPWSHPKVGTIVVERFRRQGWRVRETAVTGGTGFGIYLPKERYGHLI